MKTDRPRLRKVYILPNSLTAMNLFLGVLAIYNILLYMMTQDANRFERGCWFVLVAAVFDGFDGLVARLTHSQSEFGLQFDSLSDAVSFGVAPSVAAFATLSTLGDGLPDRVAGALCGFFAICGALRLARYNVQAHGPERTGFVGLPIPGGGGCLVLAVLVIGHYGLVKPRNTAVIPWAFGLTTGDLVTGLLRVLIVCLALFMVSEIPYPSVMRRFRLRRRMSFSTVPAVAAVAALIWGLRHHEGPAEVALFLAFFGFAFFFPLRVAISKLLGRELAPPQPAVVAGSQAQEPGGAEHGRCGDLPKR